MTEKKTAETSDESATVYVGTNVSKSVAEDARRALRGQSLASFIEETLRAKALEAKDTPRQLSEAQLVKEHAGKNGVPSRTTLISLRASGALEGLFEKRGNRVMYDERATLAFFAGRASKTPQPEASAT